MRVLQDVSAFILSFPRRRESSSDAASAADVDRALELFDALRASEEAGHAPAGDVVLGCLPVVPVAFGPEGPTGTLETTVSDYAQVLDDLERRGVISKQAARGSSIVLGFLQGKKSDDEMTVSLRFHEGQVFWGPFVLAEIPPLE